MAYYQPITTGSMIEQALQRMSDDANRQRVSRLECENRRLRRRVAELERQLAAPQPEDGAR